MKLVDMKLASSFRRKLGVTLLNTSPNLGQSQWLKFDFKSIWHNPSWSPWTVKKTRLFKKNTRTQFQIYICMSAIPGMYLICHQIHWKNLLGPNPTCNSTGSKVTFGKRTSAELAVHARSIFPTQPRMPRCIVCHRPPATSPVPQRCQWGLPFCKCYDAKLLWPLKSDHSQ